MATITFRTDPEVDAALSALGGAARAGAGACGVATIAGARGVGPPRLRAEADALAADPADRAEARAVLEDLESLRAW